MTAISALFDDETRGATVSQCGRYRYDLWRRWSAGPLLGWVMLNPSTGDAERDDHTLRKCMGYARRERLAGIVVRNLFAYRTPEPAELHRALRSGVDIVGPFNDAWLEELSERARAGDVGPVVAAWGAHPLTGLRAAQVEDLFAGGLMRLGVPRRGGAPHPARLATNIPLVSYEEVGHR